MIDLRSDTVTLPSIEMRKAIYNAEVGDDVYREDPTVNTLEKEAAKLTRKDASLFVPSGTMGNLTSTLTHCRRGDEIILGDQSHIFINEQGGISSLGGIHPHIIPNQSDGTLKPSDIISAIRRDNIHYPITRLICLESTHNRCNGSPLTIEYMKAVYEIARKHNLSVHLDGARIFNAAVALNVKVEEITHFTDSLMFCLSKGLCSPVGSMICGTSEFIERARRTRKLLGGGMRQAGLLAAGGLYSLRNFRERLIEDHRNAELLVDKIREIRGISVEETEYRTNIVYFNLMDNRIKPESLVESMEKRRIKFLHTGNSRFRMVTHYGISEEDIEKTAMALKQVCADIIGDY